MENSLADGTLFIIGIGPGHPDHMSPAALKAIKAAEHIVGYKTYINLIKPLIGATTTSGFAMKKELERAQHAIALTATGKAVALICSGDAGVYGMAGLCLELLHHQQVKRADMPAIKVIPGISAAQSCASLVGAPLMHDNATISLSDLLTPIELILRRVEAAAASDFVITFYNPASARRRQPLEKSYKILQKHRLGITPVAIVDDAYRPGQNYHLTDLDNFLKFDIGMSSTIIVGNSQSFIYEGYMITPRGYRSKYFGATSGAEDGT